MSRISKNSRSDGFTLIETLIVLVLLGIAAAVVTTMHGGIGAMLNWGHSTQTMAMLQQRCAEDILARRRNNGLTSAVTTAQGTGSCTFGGQSISINVNEGYAGVGCPAGVRCALLTFSGFNLPNMTLVLIDYEI